MHDMPSHHPKLYNKITIFHCSFLFSGGATRHTVRPPSHGSSLVCEGGAPSCSFDKHGVLLIIFGNQHTFRNDMRILLSLFLHVYLLYLLLNSCDVNDAFCMASLLVKQSGSCSRNTGFSSADLCPPNSPDL